MGILRMLRIMILRRLSAKIFAIVLIVLVCVAGYTYVSLQSNEARLSGSEKRGRHSDQSGVVRFRARPPWHKTPGIVEHEVHDEALIRNDTIISGGPLEVPRVAEYCNIPTEVQLGEEGEVPPGYTLVAAYALIRHGDRTPMNTLLDVPRPQPREGCIMNRASLKKYPEFRRFMYDMAIAKDKQAPGSYFAKWALYPQHKDCGNSQLTGRGALQHLHNGLALKEKYVKKWNLFGDKFSPATQLKLRSTQYSRTYQSAVSFLYAFLPHFDITQLDIQASADTVFCHAKYVPQACCNALIKLKQAVDRPPNNRGRKSPHYIPAFGPLAEVFETKAGRLPYAAAIIDTLQGHACHFLRLPCGKGGKCVSTTMMRNLWTLVDSDGESLAADKRFDVYSRIAMRSLLLEMAADMEAAAHNFTLVKFSLYSGHDITVSPLLQVLGLNDGKWPHYATRVVFELYKETGGREDNYIRILYNGRDVTSRCRLCRNGLNNDGLCHLREFSTALAKDVDDFTEGQSLNSFCQSLPY